MYVAEERRGRLHALPAAEISYAGSPLAGRILSLLVKNPSYPREIARTLKENEQKIYYHIRKLEKSGLVRIVRKEERGGAIAKYYALAKPAFVMRFGEMKEARKIPRGDFPPFIADGKMNAKLVVGSPDPHGPEHARSRDAHYAIDLGLFFGTFLTESKPSVHLDTDMRGEDLKDNLIVIGGPVINKISAMMMKTDTPRAKARGFPRSSASRNNKMQIRFDRKRNIFSAKTRRTYKSDETGFILNVKNPFDESKKLLLIAGKRHSGTRAAIFALIKNFELINKKSATIVSGLDRDYDGIVDDAEILE